MGAFAAAAGALDDDGPSSGCPSSLASPTGSFVGLPLGRPLPPWGSHGHGHQGHQGQGAAAAVAAAAQEDEGDGVDALVDEDGVRVGPPTSARSSSKGLGSWRTLPAAATPPMSWSQQQQSQPQSYQPQSQSQQQPQHTVSGLLAQRAQLLEELQVGASVCAREIRSLLGDGGCVRLNCDLQAGKC